MFLFFSNSDLILIYNIIMLYRLNRASNSTKSNVRPSPRAAAFNFRSSERAERRKEASEILSF